MPNSSNPAHVVVSVMLIVISLPVMLLGIGGLIGMDEIWWVFALLAASGAMIFYGGVAGIRRWRKATVAEAANTRAMVEAARASSTFGARLPAPVLAHWTYDPAEWRAYNRREMTYRRREALGIGFGVAALGVLMIGLTEGDWGAAVAVSAVIGGIIGVGRWLMARSRHRANAEARFGEVIIAPNALLMNGRYQVLNDEVFRFGGVKILENEHPPIVEFTVKWRTRNGWTNEQYRVPIPAGKKDEARSLVEAFRATYSAAALAG